jgi:hypothetical protein
MKSSLKVHPIAIKFDTLELALAMVDIGELLVHWYYMVAGHCFF